MTDKPTNPKDVIGSTKLPLHLWPQTATALGAMALLDGALKYGRSNFRVTGVRASIYVDAAMRHLIAYFEGEDTDPDSGLPQLAHVLACIAILVDAEAAGKLNDDRMVQGGYRGLLDRLTPHVARLQALYADRDPQHFTIADNAQLVMDLPPPAAANDDAEPVHEVLEALGLDPKPAAPGCGIVGGCATPKSCAMRDTCMAVMPKARGF